MSQSESREPESAPDPARPDPDDESSSAGVTGQVDDPRVDAEDEPVAERSSAPEEGLADRGVPSDPAQPSG